VRGRERLALLAIAGCALGSALPADGQEPDSATAEPADTTVRRVAGITVRATRPVARGGVASAVELAADSVRLAPAPTLDELLREMPLVRLRTNSRGEVQPSLRGMEERQIAILLDGIPLTLGWDDRTDLSAVPLAGARRVTLVRGLSSVLAGPNVLGGFLRVDLAGGSAAAPPEPRGSLAASVDQVGALEVAASAGTRIGVGTATLGLRAGAGIRDRPGLVRPGSVAPVGSGDADLLPNTQRRSLSGYAALRLDADAGWWAALSAVGFGSRRGVLPELHLLEPGEPEPRYWRIPDHRRGVVALSAGTGRRRTPLGRGELSASMGIDLQHQEIDAYSSLAYQDSVGGETGDDRTLTGRVEAAHDLAGGEIRGAFTLAETRHVAIVDPSERAVYRQRLWSLGAEVEQPLSNVTGAWLSRPAITVGASVDRSSTPRSGGFPSQPAAHGWGGRVAGSALVAGGVARIHGGLSRKVRFAALRELYSGALGKFEPNPDLGPETLWVAEAGVTAHPGRNDLQVTLFQQRLRGSVVRVATPRGTFRRENRGETRATGLEVVAGAALGDVSVRVDATLQRVRLLGARPGELPEYQPALSAGLRVEAPLPAALGADLAADLTGRQYGVDPGSGRAVALDPSVWLSAGIRRSFPLPAGGGRRTTVLVRLENPIDAVVYEQLGLPRPGRSVRIGVEVH
jgi:iron complex outermembrane receptor protein